MITTISICDSDNHFKTLLTEYIDRKIAFQLNDHYNNGLDLINRIYHKQNSYILVNTFTPIMTGFEAIKVLRDRKNLTPIITYSHVFQQDIYEQLQKCEHVYYCQKNSTAIFSLLQALQNNNHEYYAQYITTWSNSKKEVNDYIAKQQQQAYTPSPNELRIIHLTCQGLTSKEIAEKINLSNRTIEKIIKKLTEKFNVRNKIQLITYCVERSLHKYQ